MVTTKEIDDIIEVVMERIFIEGPHSDDAYPQMTTKDRNELLSIVKDIIEGKHAK